MSRGDYQIYFFHFWLSEPSSKEFYIIIKYSCLMVIIRTTSCIFGYQIWLSEPSSKEFISLKNCHASITVNQVFMKRKENFSCLMVIIRTTFCIFGYQSLLPVLYQVFTKRKQKTFHASWWLSELLFAFLAITAFQFFTKFSRKKTKNFSGLVVIIRTTFRLFGYHGLLPVFYQVFAKRKQKTFHA